MISNLNSSHSSRTVTAVKPRPFTELDFASHDGYFKNFFRFRPFTELDFASRDGVYKDFFQKSERESMETDSNVTAVQPVEDSDLSEITEEPRLVFKSRPFTELDFANPNGVFKEYFPKSEQESREVNTSSSSRSTDMSRKRRLVIDRNTTVIPCDTDCVVPRKRKFVVRRRV
jgi:hypothetical protein